MEDSLRRELEPALAAEKGKRRPSYGMVYWDDGVRQGQGREEEDDDAVRVFCFFGGVFSLSLCIPWHGLISSHQAPPSQTPHTKQMGGADAAWGAGGAGGDGGYHDDHDFRMDDDGPPAGFDDDAAAAPPMVMVRACFVCMCVCIYGGNTLCDFLSFCVLTHIRPSIFILNAGG